MHELLSFKNGAVIRFEMRFEIEKSLWKKWSHGTRILCKRSILKKVLVKLFKVMLFTRYVEKMKSAVHTIYGSLDILKTGQHRDEVASSTKVR